MGRQHAPKTPKTLVRLFWSKLSKTLTKDQKDKIIPIELKDEICFFCNSKEIKWKNNLFFYYSCDECVPRGCSCTLYKLSERDDFDIDNYEYKLGNDNKEIPCEDWHKL